MSTSHAVRLISFYMLKHERLLWDAVSLSKALGNDIRQYPRSEGYLYRKTLEALSVMVKYGVMKKYTTTMNENVYYEIARTLPSSDLPF